MSKRKDPQWWKFSELDKPPDSSPTPDCFTDEEWAAYYEAEKQAVWNKKSLSKSIRSDMCEDCTLAYQYSQIKAGKCKPYYGVMTPVHRMAMILAGEEDPVEKRKSRAAPWTELPVLSGESVRSGQDGAGIEERTASQDNDLVLPE